MYVFKNYFRKDPHEFKIGIERTLEIKNNYHILKYLSNLFTGVFQFE
jgi:hypothetical protein